MKILVLLKAVAANTGGYTGEERRNTELVPNPADITALEEALSLRDGLGGEVTALTMGPASALPLLRDAVARGADRAAALMDAAFAGADTAATSRVIAAAVERLGGFDLILCGRKTTDGETGQVGTELAARLGLGFITNCLSLSIDAGRVECRRLADGGTETLSAPLPLLASVVYGINSPRLASIEGLRRAKRTDCEIMDRAALALPRSDCGITGSPTQVLRSFASPFEKRQAEFVPADRPDIALARIEALLAGGRRTDG